MTPHIQYRSDWIDKEQSDRSDCLCSAASVFLGGGDMLSNLDQPIA